jgi:predicted metal-dependent phosphoesterase TrpH
MTDFLLEMHTHTSEVSPCAYIPAIKVTELYKNESYNGIVITDHMCSHTFRNMPNSTWKEKVDYFLNGYRLAKSCSTNDFIVLLGMEICFSNETNDYLVYGLDESFLFNNKDLMDLGLKKFRTLADEYSLLIFQAHPFRKGMRIADYRLLDGIEVYNGNSSHNSSNDIAMAWADKYSLKKVSGSDFHCFFGMHPGGIYFADKIKTNAELLQALRNNEYKLR